MVKFSTKVSSNNFVQDFTSIIFDIDVDAKIHHICIHTKEWGKLQNTSLFIILKASVCRLGLNIKWW